MDRPVLIVKDFTRAGTPDILEVLRNDALLWRHATQDRHTRRAHFLKRLMHHNSLFPPVAARARFSPHMLARFIAAWPMFRTGPIVQPRWHALAGTVHAPRAHPKEMCVR